MLLLLLLFNRVFRDPRGGWRFFSWARFKFRLICVRGGHLLSRVSIRWRKIEWERERLLFSFNGRSFGGHHHRDNFIWMLPNAQECFVKQSPPTSAVGNKSAKKETCHRSLFVRRLPRRVPSMGTLLQQCECEPFEIPKQKWLIFFVIVTLCKWLSMLPIGIFCNSKTNSIPLLRFIYEICSSSAVDL